MKKMILFVLLAAAVGALEKSNAFEGKVFESKNETSLLDKRTGFEMFFGNETSEFLEKAYRKRIFRKFRRESDPSYFQDNLIKEQDFKMLIDTLITRKGLSPKSFVKLKEEQKDLGNTEELVDARTATDVLSMPSSKVVTLNALLEEAEEDDEEESPLRHIQKLAKDLRDGTGAPSVGMNLYLSRGDSNVLPPHTDRYDVFVIQIYGWKKWTTCVSKTPVHFNEAIRAELYESQRGLTDGCTNYEESNLKGDNGMQCQDFLLGPGDVL